MARGEAEALALRWRDTKRAKDYATADAIRTQLRAVGIEAEELVQEIEIFGLSDLYDDVSDGAAGAGAQAPAHEPDPNDQLAYREHMTSKAKALFQPTEAAARHKDGGTGGLLCLNYSVVEDLPKELGFIVTAGKTQADKDALTAYKEIMKQKEEEERREIFDRNTRNLRGGHR